MNITNTCLSIFFIFLMNPCIGTDYYFHSLNGNDEYKTSSIIHPFKTLDKLKEVQLEAGDRILLAEGEIFQGNISLKNVHGTPQSPIEISTYSWRNSILQKRATIEVKGALASVVLTDCSHITVKNIVITSSPNTSSKKEQFDMRCGVLVNTSVPGDFGGIRLENLWISNIFYQPPGFERGKDEVRTANGTQAYGWGIRFINRVDQAFLRNVKVISCVVENVAHTGIKFTGRNHNIQNIEVRNNRVLKTGGPGVQMSGVKNGHIKENYIHQSGSNDDSRKWGRGSGLWTWGSSEVLIEHNYFLNANGPGDSAGCHIDFNCEHIVVQYNVSANNAGGFCEILGNNFNCAYRYNISINDGHRIKGENGAFQEGKTFWLSGYTGRKKKRHGPYNSYFYNNTIFLKQEIVSKVAVTKTAQGVLIANNIFCIQGETEAVLGDQYNPDKGSRGIIDRVIFENNLFIKPDAWPSEVLVQPENTSIGDPLFSNAGGLSIYDYIPLNEKLIRNKGQMIEALPNDSLGLKLGLKVEYDILGNPIKGTPDLGAIEIN